MSIESLVEAYETLLGKYKDKLKFFHDTSGERIGAGQYIAHVEAALIPDSPDSRTPNAIGLAAHTNPSVALLLAKAIAVSELVGEPTLPFYTDTQDLHAAHAPHVPSPTSGSVPVSAAAAPSAPVNNASRPVVDPDGKVRCWELDSNGHECGVEIKEWDGKSAQQLGEDRKKRYGLVLCPKHIALRKKAQGR